MKSLGDFVNTPVKFHRNLNIHQLFLTTMIWKAGDKAILQRVSPDFPSHWYLLKRKINRNQDIREAKREVIQQLKKSSDREVRTVARTLNMMKFLSTEADKEEIFIEARDELIKILKTKSDSRRAFLKRGAAATILTLAGGFTAVLRILYPPGKWKYNTLAHRVLYFYAKEEKRDYEKEITLLEEIIAKAEEEIKKRRLKSGFTILKTIHALIEGFGFKMLPLGQEHLGKGLSSRELDCNTVSIIYYAIGEVLKFPINLVPIPVHAFVRWSNTISWETTNGTEIRDEKKELVKQFAIHENSIKMGSYLANASEKEILGLFMAEWVSIKSHYEVPENVITLIRSIAPNMPFAMLTCGNWYGHSGMFKQAKAIFDKGLILDPNYFDIPKTLGKNMFNRGKYKEAITYSKKCIDTMRSLRFTRLTLKSAQVLEHRFPTLKDASEVNKTLAKSYEGLNQFEDAVKHWFWEAYPWKNIKEFKNLNKVDPDPIYLSEKAFLRAKAWEKVFGEKAKTLIQADLRLPVKNEYGPAKEMLEKWKKL